MLYTTKCKDENGKVFDIGAGEYPPSKDNSPLIVNAWCEPVK